MPLVSRTFDQLIDFTRTSAATYVDSTGKIVPTPASRNLLTFTQEFDNAAWVKTAATITANAATAPDGTLTADALVDDTTSSQHRLNQGGVNLTSGVPYAVSLYAKAGTHNFIQLLVTAGGGTNAWFTVIANLATGAITQTGNGTSGTLASSSITSVGNGWYRIAMAGMANATSTFRIAMVPAASGNSLGATDGAVTYTGTGTSLFIWGAQLEAVPDANLTLGSEVVTVNSATLTGATGYTAITGSAVVALAEYLVTYTCTLSGGTIQAVVGGTALTSVSASGTYRAIVTAGATTAPQFYSSAATGSISNFSVKQITGTTGMPTDYTRNNGGVYPPRFDYDPVTLAPKGLLVEEQRTNLFTYSQDFTNAAWGGDGTTKTTGLAGGLDGTASVAEFSKTFAGSHYPRNSATNMAANTTYTISMWLWHTGTAPADVKFTYYSGTWNLSPSFTVTTTPTRFTWTVTTGATAPTLGTGLYLSFGADGGAIRVWGAQLEAGSFATSYIPTVASQVTRTADVATITGANFSQFYNQSEGTWVVELQKLSPSSTATYGVEVTGASSNFSMRVRLGTDARMQSVDGGVAVVDAQLAASVPTTVSKYGIAYKLNDYAGSAGGAAAVTDTSATVPALSALSIGSAGVTNLYVRSIRYYPTSLKSQLPTLTA